MSKTGFIQASIAYKVSSATGEPLDVDGVLCSISGKKQAIAILEGAANPNPTRYEVESTFKARGSVNGEPSIEYAPDRCPSGFILVDPARVRLVGDATRDIVIASSDAWVLSADSNIATILKKKGDAGDTSNTVSRTMGREGVFAYQFKNIHTGDTAELYIESLDSIRWILTTGRWDGFGVWKNNEKFKFK